MNWFTNDIFHYDGTDGPPGFYEYTGDIFEHFDKRLNGEMVSHMPTPDKFFLVQAISGDCAMGAGIAKAINDRYHFRDEVIGEIATSFSGYEKDGWTFDKHTCEFKNMSKDGKIQILSCNAKIGSIISCEACPNILSIVTKGFYYNKPTLESMKTALVSLADQIRSDNFFMDDRPITELIFPTIGCGLDKLKWKDVRCIIFETFEDMLCRGDIQIIVIKRRGGYYA